MSHNHWPKPEPESGHDEWIRKERDGDDPAKNGRASINGICLFQDEVYDATPIKTEKPRKTSALFDQVVADTRARLIEIGEIKL